MYSITKKLTICFLLASFTSSDPDPDEEFVCFVALRPKSTAMVMRGRSVHLTTLFPGQG